MSYCHIDEKRGSNSELPPSFISFIPSRAKPAPARPACRKGMHPPRRSALRRSAQAGTRPQPCSRRGGRQAAQPRPQQKGRLPKGADSCSPICRASHARAHAAHQAMQCAGKAGVGPQRRFPPPPRVGQRQEGLPPHPHGRPATPKRRAGYGAPSAFCLPPHSPQTPSL